MIYRHIGDDSVRFEVSDADPRWSYQDGDWTQLARYEVRRLDQPEVFGGQSFIVDARDFEQTYEPVPVNASEEQ